MVSICLATFNGEKYLAEMLSSIQRQTYSDFECVIVDDHSKDNTLNIIQEFCKKDDRFKCFINITDINNKYVDAHNLSYANAKGDYIIHVDQDDILKEHAVETLVSFLENNKEYDGVCGACDFFYINEYGEMLFEDIMPLEYLEELQREFNKDNHFAFFNHPDSWRSQISCFRRDFYQREKPQFSTIIEGDVVFLLDVLNHGAKLYSLNDRLLYYRYHDNNFHKTDAYHNYDDCNFQIAVATLKYEICQKHYNATLDQEYYNAMIVFHNTIEYFKNKLIEQNEHRDI